METAMQITIGKTKEYIMNLKNRVSVLIKCHSIVKLLDPLVKINPGRIRDWKNTHINTLKSPE